MCKKLLEVLKEILATRRCDHMAPMRWWQSRLSLDLATSERQDKNMQDVEPLPIDCVTAAAAFRWYPAVDLTGWKRRDGWPKETASQNFSRTWCPPQTVLFKGPEFQTCLKQSRGSKNGTVASCVIVTSYFIAVSQLQPNRRGGKQRSR